jgi:hypothetical protein
MADREEEALEAELLRRAIERARGMRPKTMEEPTGKQLDHPPLGREGR